MTQLVRVSDRLYRVTRTSRDVEALASGAPRRIARRVKNRLVGRFVSRALRGLWR